MKWFKRALIILWLAILLLPSPAWFASGFRFVPQDEMISIVEPTGWGSWIHAESDDSGWYWAPPFLTEIWTTRLPFAIPTFHDWLAMAEAWDREVDYYDEYFTYHPPKADWSLRLRTLDILPYLDAADIKLVDAHLPKTIEFEKYDPRERYRLGGYYIFDADRVSLNEEYLEGGAWDERTFLATLVHELVHSTGHFNESQTEFLAHVVLARMAQDGDMEAAWALAISMRGDALGMAYLMARWDFTVPISNPWAAANIAYDLQKLERPYTGWVLQAFVDLPAPWWKLTYRINNWLREQRHKTYQAELRDTIQRLLTPAEQLRRATIIKAWADDPAAHQAAFIQYTEAPQFMRLGAKGNIAILEFPAAIECSFFGCFLVTQPQEVNIHEWRKRAERIYPAPASRYEEFEMLEPGRGDVIEYSPASYPYSLSLLAWGAWAFLLYILLWVYTIYRLLRLGVRGAWRRLGPPLRAEWDFLGGKR